MANAGTHTHASCNRTHRAIKAEKIIRLLEMQRSLGGLRILEVGTGSGVIAACLAARVGADGVVMATDIVDQRIARDGYRFVQVKDTHQPFPDASFDIVVSNHVIEHVGDDTAQRHHLRELRRVMRDDGIGYLAVPNRWSIHEPHYRLPFLSWLPQPLADAYLRGTSKGRVYDCHPPGPLRLRRWLTASELRWHSVSGQALRLMVELEGGSRLAQFAARVPLPLLQWLSMLMPTMIFLIECCQQAKSWGRFELKSIERRRD